MSGLLPYNLFLPPLRRAGLRVRLYGVLTLLLVGTPLLVTPAARGLPPLPLACGEERPGHGENEDGNSGDGEAGKWSLPPRVQRQHRKARHPLPAASQTWRVSWLALWPPGGRTASYRASARPPHPHADCPLPLLC